MRLRGGLRYQRSAFQAGGEIVAVAKQDRVFGEETPTDGYSLLKLFAAYSFGAGRRQYHHRAAGQRHQRVYRNHLSFVKDFVPEMGRNFKLVYSVRFLGQLASESGIEFNDRYRLPSSDGAPRPLSGLGRRRVGRSLTGAL